MDALHLPGGMDSQVTLNQGTLIGDLQYPAFDLRLLSHYLAEQLGEAYRQRLLEHLCLTSQELESRQFVLAWQMLEGLSLAARWLPGPAAGVRFGQGFRPGDLDLLQASFSRCATLGELYRTIKQQPTLVGSFADVLEYSSAQRFSVRSLNVADIDPVTFAFLFEHSISSMRSIAQSLCQREVPFLQVHLPLPDPGPTATALYQQLLGCPVLFEQPAFEWHIAQEVLDYPLTWQPAPGVELSQAEFSAPSLIDQIQSHLFQHPDAFPSQEALAAQLGMSTRTFRRRLKELGTSYQGLQNQVRCQLALAWLHDHRYPIEEIGERLGFRDVSNFRHAFKRWLGRAPGQLFEIP